MSGSSSNGSTASTPSTTSTLTGVPRVGGVRCYWALLSPSFPNPAIPGSKLELVFVHPDPVLAIHLQRQRLSMMGRGVLEFIHPGEREQARTDLTSAISSDDLQGSVTRVRFARLSWIRRILGGKPEEIEPVYDASTFAEDDEYLILDIVLNWVAEGIVLAFFHAIKDKDPVLNNDPRKSHEEWTNYCGTANMGEDQIDALHQNIATYIPLPQPSRFPPSRVFQLHTSSISPVRPNQLVFTWPPSRPSHSGARNDGLYDAEEYSNLMKGVDMDPAQLSSQKDEIRTNCTTRFGAQHSITTEGVYRVVSSVFIPYGSLIFACFQTIKQVELQQRSPATMVSSSNHHHHNHNHSHSHTHAHTHTHSHTHSIGEPQHQMQINGTGSGAITAGAGASAGSVSGSSSASASGSYGLMTPSQNWNLPSSSDWPRPPPPQPQSQQPSQSQPQPSQQQSLPAQSQSVAMAMNMKSDEGYQSSSYDRMAYPQSYAHPHSQPHAHPHLPHPSTSTSASQAPHLQPHLHEVAVAQGPHTSHTSSARGYYDEALDPYPPGPGSIPNEAYPTPPSAAFLDRSPPQMGPGGSSRPLVRPPGNVDCCRICGLKESPEWRRSETGIKDLCNACGLRLARQVAKREGRQKPRKKKDKLKGD